MKSLYFRILAGVIFLFMGLSCSRPVMIFHPEELSSNRKWVKVGDIPVVYTDQGKGETILILSSFPLGLETWNGLVQLLTPSFRVVVVEPPWLTEPYAMGDDFSSEHLLQIYRKFVRSLRIPKVHVMGVGEGGGLAISFGHHFPEHTLTTISINGFEGVNWSAKARPVSTRKLIDQLYDPSEKGIIDLMMTSSIRYREDISLRNRIKPTLHITNNKEILRAVQARKEALIQDIKSLFILSMIEYIDFPVLMIRSGGDSLLHESYVEWARSRIHGEEFYFLPRAGHFAFLDQPGKVAALVKDFITRHPEEL